MPAPNSPTQTGTPVQAPDDLVGRFQRAWTALEPPREWRRLLVAVSGGPDSLALLHLLHQTRGIHQMDLVVAHADHGIHPESAGVAQRVAVAARDLGLPIIVGRLALGAGTSETSARTLPLPTSSTQPASARRIRRQNRFIKSLASRQ